MVFLAQTALYSGDYEEAYELETRALALDPAGVWQNLFFPTIPLYLGRPSEAADALRRASQMVPGEATLTSVEGLIAAHEGNFERAEQFVRTGKQEDFHATLNDREWKLYQRGPCFGPAVL